MSIGHDQVQARKPEWAGAKQSIKRKSPRPEVTSAPPAVSPAAHEAVAAWDAAALDHNPELIDDEQLLTAEDRVKPDAPGRGPDPNRQSLAWL